MRQVEKPEVGMVLYSSWGYDQTNIDFYKVVRVSDKGSVWVMPMSRQYVENVGFMSDMVMPGGVIEEREVREYFGEPNANGFQEWRWVKVPVKPARHKWHDYGINLNSYSSAWVWDGKAKNMTSYA